MKNKYIFISLMFFSFCSFAQTNIPDNYPKNVVKLKILSLAIDELKFQYERVLYEHLSITIDAGYISDKIGVTQMFAKQGPIDGVDISPEIRYYFTGKAPKGFYCGAYGLLIYFKETYKNVYFIRTTNEKILGGGIMVGKQWLISNLITIDLDAGCGVYNSESVFIDSNNDPYSNNNITNTHYRNSNVIVPVVNLSIGYAF